MENEDQAGRPERVRLAGFREPAARDSAPRDEEWPEADAGGPGARRSRRAPAWTVAALVAVAAAATGYLAHEIPAITQAGTGAQTTGTGTGTGKSGTVSPASPAVHAPVVTSGGSGGSGGGRDD